MALLYHRYYLWLYTDPPLSAPLGSSNRNCLGQPAHNIIRGVRKLSHVITPTNGVDFLITAAVLYISRVHHMITIYAVLKRWTMVEHWAPFTRTEEKVSCCYQSFLLPKLDKWATVPLPLPYLAIRLSLWCLNDGGHRQNSKQSLLSFAAWATKAPVQNRLLTYTINTLLP